MLLFNGAMDEVLACHLSAPSVELSNHEVFIDFSYLSSQRCATENATEKNTKFIKPTVTQVSGDIWRLYITLQ